MPLPDRALTSVFLSYSGHSILFDCGEGTQTAARKSHISLMKTDLIALTHYHGDHIFGLPGLLQTMGCLGRTQPLYIIGPDGLEKVMELIVSMSGQMPFPIYALFPMERSESKDFYSFRISDYISEWPGETSLTVFKTEHRVESCGYSFHVRRPGKFIPENAEKAGVPKRLWGTLQKGESIELDDGRVIYPDSVLGQERKGLSVVFSGDTSPCSNLIKASADADLLICDSTYGDSSHTVQAEKYGHSTFAEAAGVAKEAGVKRLWLTHFSQIMEDPDEFLNNAAEVFPDSVCGKDGLSVSLKFED